MSRSRIRKIVNGRYLLSLKGLKLIMRAELNDTLRGNWKPIRYHELELIELFRSPKDKVNLASLHIPSYSSADLLRSSTK